MVAIVPLYVFSFSYSSSLFSFTFYVLDGAIMLFFLPTTSYVDLIPSND